jgi:phosphonate transport system substrate-binding protein
MSERHLQWASFLAPNMSPVYEFTAAFVGDQLGCKTSFTTGRSLGEFESGAADVGFICGLPYVELTRLTPAPVELVAAPVLAGDRYDDRPIYFSDVIVSSDSRATSFEDLKGCSWSYNEPHSHSGYNVVCHRLTEMDSDAGFFGQIVGAGWHQRSIEMVAEREIDASAIDSQVLAVELRKRPELVELIRVIDVLGPSTIQPVVAATRLDPGLTKEIKAVLVEMADDAGARSAFAHGFVNRWEEIEDDAYDDIRTMLDAVERAGVTLHTSDSLPA